MQSISESCEGVTPRDGVAPSYEQMTLDGYILEALREKQLAYGELALAACCTGSIRSSSRRRNETLTAARQKELAEPLRLAAASLAAVRSLYTQCEAVDLHLTA